MADRNAIEQLFADYGWPMDTQDWPILESVFTEDADFAITIPGMDRIGPINGRDAIIEFCSSTVGDQDDQRRHVITNIRIINETDTTADVFAILSLIVVANGSLAVQSSGMYRTKVARGVDGNWRFTSMVIELDLPF